MRHAPAPAFRVSYTPAPAPPLLQLQLQLQRHGGCQAAAPAAAPLDLLLLLRRAQYGRCVRAAGRRIWQRHCADARRLSPTNGQLLGTGVLGTRTTLNHAAGGNHMIAQLTGGASSLSWVLSVTPCKATPVHAWHVLTVEPLYMEQPREPLYTLRDTRTTLAQTQTQRTCR